MQQELLVKKLDAMTSSREQEECLQARNRYPYFAGVVNNAKNLFNRGSTMSMYSALRDMAILANPCAKWRPVGPAPKRTN
eukprot:scaffold2765_cov165-Amphora_coffeaeformis.AAC.13